MHRYHFIVYLMITIFIFPYLMSSVVIASKDIETSNLNQEPVFPDASSSDYLLDQGDYAVKFGECGSGGVIFYDFDTDPSEVFIKLIQTRFTKSSKMIFRFFEPTHNQLAYFKLFSFRGISS